MADTIVDSGDAERRARSPIFREPGERGDADGEREDAQVDREVERHRTIGGRHHANEQPASPEREEHADGGAEQ